VSAPRGIERITRELHAALKRETADIIAIGNLLIEAREKLNHGEFLPWVTRNFTMSSKSAENYMAAARFADKFETVSNLKLLPTALYMLGHDLASPSGLFDRRAIRAIFTEAKTQYVSATRATRIAKLLRDPFAEVEEVDEILDGPPPELPAAPETSVHDVVLPPFDQAITTLTALRTKPMAKFTNTTHPASVIRAIGDFLHDVANTVESETAPDIAAE